MNTIFEIKYKCTEDVYKGIYKYVYLHNKLTYVIGAFYVVWGILTNYYSLTEGNGFKVSSVLYLGVIAACMVLYSRLAAKRQYNSDLSANKNTPVVNNFFVREDVFVVKFSNASAKTIAYKEFKKVVNNKEYFILIGPEKIAYYIKKDSFVKGTCEEFEAFWKGKGFKF